MNIFDDSVGTPWMWAGFLVLVVGMLAVDLLAHRKAHETSMKEAVAWTAVWIAIGVAFGVAVGWWKGGDIALAYFAGYLIEKSLSIDNIFVFVVLFGTFAIPAALQHRVLFWGVLGALIMRAIFVLIGTELLHHFHWVIIPLGGFLVVTGVRMLMAKGEMHPEDSRIFKWLTSKLPTSKGFDGQKFFTIENGKRLATPLLLALLAIELTDVLFAVDSVPAVFAVTEDPFIVFTSNIFALLGLRSLYFVLAGALAKLRYLKVGLSLVLMFVGAKMLLTPLYKIPIGISLGVIAVLVGGSVIISLWRDRRDRLAAAAAAM